MLHPPHLRIAEISLTYLCHKSINMCRIQAYIYFSNLSTSLVVMQNSSCSLVKSINEFKFVLNVALYLNAAAFQCTYMWQPNYIQKIFIHCFCSMKSTSRSCDRVCIYSQRKHPGHIQLGAHSSGSGTAGTHDASMFVFTVNC